MTFANSARCCSCDQSSSQLSSSNLSFHRLTWFLQHVSDRRRLQDVPSKETLPTCINLCSQQEEKFPRALATQNVAYAERQGVPTDACKKKEKLQQWPRSILERGVLNEAASEERTGEDMKEKFGVFFETTSCVAEETCWKLFF